MQRLGGGGGVAVAFDVLLAADRRAERVAKVLRRAVVDDRVDARVEVRETGAQHEHGVEQVGVSRRSVEGDDEQKEVDRKPEKGEDYDDENQQPTNLTLAIRRTRLFLSHINTSALHTHAKTILLPLLQLHDKTRQESSAVIRKPRDAAAFFSVQTESSPRTFATSLRVAKLRRPGFRAPNRISRKMAIQGHSQSRVLESVERR